ncbi:unnamed protein product [Nippostrongylus brasiliensis]|uniref:Uncharacterized protein n=1 Tax=Nippostrongylus brasiliensis TaxID=27835 RepID=A0A0N4YT49_NIPBR|nr:unnamed protein product [Nippostrongylus brasiliensis]
MFCIVPRYTNVEMRKAMRPPFLKINLNFDESNGSVVYSEIRKKPSHESTAKEISDRESTIGTHPVDGSTSSDQAEMPPPPVPPKPRSASAMADPIVEMPERRGVLPAQVRPLVQRPPSPREAGRATPSIEPDLVGKDRYDKASKCFSYAPTKALNEAFERPRKSSVSKIERKEDEIQNIDPDEISSVSIMSCLVQLTFKAPNRSGPEFIP